MAKRTKIKLHTVNVIEMTEGTVQQVVSFTDNPKGNARAEKLFKQLVLENSGDTPPNEQELAAHVEDGTFGTINGYDLYLTHST